MHFLTYIFLATGEQRAGSWHSFHISRSRTPPTSTSYPWQLSGNHLSTRVHHLAAGSLVRRAQIRTYKKVHVYLLYTDTNGLPSAALLHYRWEKLIEMVWFICPARVNGGSLSVLTFAETRREPNETTHCMFTPKARTCIWSLVWFKAIWAS